MHDNRLGLPQTCAQFCMMLLMQTQDSAESLGLLLNELYGYTEAKSVIDADTVLPLLLIAGKLMSRRSCCIALSGLIVTTMRS